MANPDYCLVVFESTSGAIRAEKLAREAGLTVKLIPVPRHLSSDCGVCLRCEARDVEGIRALLDAAKVEFEAVRSW